MKRSNRRRKNRSNNPCLPSKPRRNQGRRFLLFPSKRKKKKRRRIPGPNNRKKNNPEMVKLYFCIAEMQNDILKVTRQAEATEEQIKKLTQEKQRLLAQVGQMNGELAKLVIKFDLAVQKLKDCVQ